MAPPSAPTLVFKVHRREPELIAPSKPTPHEFKPLSDIDDQEGLRFHLPVIMFYRKEPLMEGKDPVKIIKEAISKTLVFYYPIAGRLRERAQRKLVVECTGEGVLFIEAYADVTLEQFGDSLLPPFPWFEELLFDVPGSSNILNVPLMVIQVTRLKCEGFVITFRANHTVCDGAGLLQFWTAVGEMARGAASPSIMPVWDRHLMAARDPPRVTCSHPEYEQVADTNGTIIPPDHMDMAHRSFFFGPHDLASLRRLVHPNLRNCSNFELLTACLWKCRTISLQPDPTEEMRMILVVNGRSKLNPPLPKGYYGNSLVFPAAVAAAGELANKPLSYALDLIRKAKDSVNDEYFRSVADLLVIKGRPNIVLVRSYLVSDLTKFGFGEVDFGWGKPVYCGPAEAGVGAISSYLLATKNEKGENGIVLPIWLPAQAMDRFSKILNGMLQNKTTATQSSSSIMSSL